MNAANCHIDELESRRLFSANVVDGMLVVVGSNGPDRIILWQDAGSKGPVVNVMVESLLTGRPPEVYQFPAEGINTVVVQALAGDDIVALFPAPGAAPSAGPAATTVAGAISIPSRIDAGLGNDNVTGGDARDTILGGFGNDHISGGPGNDFILGGWGNDVLWGNSGNDFVSGNYGDDYVYGNEGDDYLLGGAGNDHVGFNGAGPAASEPGNDVVIGGPGEDWLVGGAGNDRIYGGSGRDHWSREDADSEMLDRTPDEPKDVPVYV